MVEKDLLLDRRRHRRRREKRERRERLAALRRKPIGRSRVSHPFFGALWCTSLPGTNRQDNDVQDLRKRLEDKTLKLEPSLKLTNEQHRKRESKRCGRMIR